MGEKISYAVRWREIKYSAFHVLLTQDSQVRARLAFETQQMQKGRNSALLTQSSRNARMAFETHDTCKAHTFSYGAMEGSMGGVESGAVFLVGTRCRSPAPMLHPRLSDG